MSRCDCTLKVKGPLHNFPLSACSHRGGARYCQRKCLHRKVGMGSTKTMHQAGMQDKCFGVR